MLIKPKTGGLGMKLWTGIAAGTKSHRIWLFVQNTMLTTVKVFSEHLVWFGTVLDSSPEIFLAWWPSMFNLLQIY